MTSESEQKAVHLTPELEADIIADVLNSDGWEIEVVAPGVLEFFDYCSEQPQGRKFRMTFSEVDA